MEDIYVTAKYDIGKMRIFDNLSLLAVYHDFSAEDSCRDLDNEIDAGIFSDFHKHFTIGLKYVDFDAEDFSTDSKKIWLWLGVKF